MYRVLIVEDDPMVASIDRSYVERTADFTVVAVCKNGVEALELFKTEEIDLVVLDYYTPGMNGDEFLDKLHETGVRPEVIMVTSANSVEIVQELLSRGISDYLVKPFEYDRFREGLERFRRRREVLQDAGTGMRQEEIDRMLSRRAASEGHESSDPLAGARVSSESSRTALHERGDCNPDRPFPHHGAPLCEFPCGARRAHEHHRLPDRRQTRNPVSV